MRIIHLIQKKQLRGAEVFACQLGNHLLIRGHQVIIVALQDGDAVLPFNGEIITLTESTSRFFHIAGWQQVANVVKHFNADLVQANAGDTLKYAVFSKLIFGWKTPVIFRNASTMSVYIHSPLVRWFNRFLFSQVTRVISVSQYSRHDFVKLFPFMTERIEVVPIGIELQELQAIQNPEQYIIHVGGFTFEKNHAGLIRIIKPLLLANEKLSLFLVGDGPLRTAIEKLVQDEGLSGRVHFLGYRADALSLMAGAKALLLPSILEGLPGVILEAQFCKVPVVAYNVGGVGEVVSTGETGWLIQKDDEEGFTHAVAAVLQDSEEKHRITEKAYQQVIQNYTNGQIAERFESIYKNLIPSSV